MNKLRRTIAHLKMGCSKFNKISLVIEGSIVPHEAALSEVNLVNNILKSLDGPFLNKIKAIT